MHFFRCVEKPLLGYICVSPFRLCLDLSLVLGLEAKGVAVVGPEEHQQCLTRRSHGGFFSPSQMGEGLLLLAAFTGCISLASLKSSKMSPI